MQSIRPLHCRLVGTVFRDGQFYLALLAAPLVLAALAWITPSLFAGSPQAASAVVMRLLWQPVIEEWLFRGFIQGAMERTTAGRWRLAGLTAANFAASLLFASAHLVNHSPAWATLVFFPSLLFGYFRTRHGSIAAPVLLHAAYNGFYLLFAGSI
jgi:membrane protease YdiL (CAAX protease family)